MQGARDKYLRNPNGLAVRRSFVQTVVGTTDVIGRSNELDIEPRGATAWRSKCAWSFS
jgi:hypothetical protein